MSNGNELSLSDDGLIELEKELIAVLHSFVTWMVKQGFSPEEAVAVALRDLDRAFRDVAKKRRRRFRLAGQHLVSAPAQEAS
jgi:hypothetical protein